MTNERCQITLLKEGKKMKRFNLIAAAFMAMIMVGTGVF